MDFIYDEPIQMVSTRASGEYYMIAYRDPKEAQMQLGRWAANPDLSFSWYDAARMGKQIRAHATEQT